MKKFRGWMCVSKSAWVLSALMLAGASGCNGKSEESLQGSGANLTSNTSTVANPAAPQAQPQPQPLPSATATATPAPLPSVTFTPLPIPLPTVSPAPKPSATPTGSDLYIGPAEVEKYVLKFIDDAKMQGVDVLPEMVNPKLEIRIASLDSYGSSTIGLCESGSRRRVTFDPDFWNRVSETQRELLAHHEFGHCILDRRHLTTKLSSGAYASVMYPTIMSSSTYLNDYDYYQEELFGYTSTQAFEVYASTGDEVHVCDGDELE